MTKQINKGFSTVDFLVMMAIISAVTSIIAYFLVSAHQNATNATRSNDVAQIARGINTYAQNNGGKYPSSGGTWGAWKCIGLPQGSETCWGGAFTGLDSLNAALLTVMNRLPKDPTLGSMSSDYYLYTSLANSIKNNPNGAYLSWFILDLGQSTPCRQGFVYSMFGTQIQCALYLGPGNL